MFWNLLGSGTLSFVTWRLCKSGFDPFIVRHMRSSRSTETFSLHLMQSDLKYCTFNFFDTSHTSFISHLTSCIIAHLTSCWIDISVPIINSIGYPDHSLYCILHMFCHGVPGSATSIQNHWVSGFETWKKNYCVPGSETLEKNLV